MLAFARGWNCPECIGCYAWIYNRNCKLKNGSNNNNIEEVTKCLPPKALLRLNIEPPAFPQPKKILAKVVWVKPPEQESLTYDIGVSFLEEIKALI